MNKNHKKREMPIYELKRQLKEIEEDLEELGSKRAQFLHRIEKKRKKLRNRKGATKYIQE